MILLERRTLEDPRNSLADWPEDSGLMADSGQKIDRKQAMQYSPVWRAVSLVSSTVAKVPLRVYRRTDDGKERARQHPAYQLLRYAPNNEQTHFYFLQTLMQHVLLEPGNAYCYIDRDGAGRPIGLLPMDPHQVSPLRENGRLWYVLSISSMNTKRRLAPSEVLHLRGPGYDGFGGMSVLEYARNSIGMGSAAQKYSNKYFDNNAEPRVVLEFPEWMAQDKIEATRNAWNSMHQGLDKQHKTAILQGGMKAHTLSLSARESQLIETLDWSVKDVANWFGVPPHKLGDSSRTAYNSLEQENQSMLSDTIDPWFVMIEEECHSKLMTEQEKAEDSHVAEFDRDALVRADIKSRALYYRQATAGHPWMTIDEVRNKENLNGLGFDQIQVPQNNFGSQDADPDGNSQRMKRATEKASAALDDAHRRLYSRVEIQYRKASKSASPAELSRLWDETCQRLHPAISDGLTPYAETLSALTDEPTDAIVSRRVNEIKNTPSKGEQK